MPTLMLFLAILGLPQAVPEIQVERLGASAYRLTASVVTADPAVAAATLSPKAAALCGASGYAFGHYEFKSVQALGEDGSEPKTVLVQDVTCGPPPAASEQAPAAPTRPPADQAEVERVNAEVTRLTNAYFDAAGAGRDAEAYAMISSAMTDATLEEWSAENRRSLGETGPGRSRTIARISIYTDPPGVDPGVYVAADYVAGWERQDECGYLVWRADKPEGPFALARRESTYLPHTLDAATRATMRQQFCIIL